MNALRKASFVTPTTSSEVRNILAFQPYLADSVDLSLLNNTDKTYLIIQSPELSKKIDTTTLSSQQIFKCLILQPSIVEDFSLDFLSDEQRQRLAARHNELADYVAINE